MLPLFLFFGIAYNFASLKYKKRHSKQFVNKITTH